MCYPGPYAALNFTTPAELRLRSGLVFIHVNVCNLLPKLDMVYIWVKNTNADIIVITESRLKKPIKDNNISINGYKSGWVKKWWGVAIYVKENH